MRRHLDQLKEERRIYTRGGLRETGLSSGVGPRARFRHRPGAQSAEGSKPSSHVAALPGRNSLHEGQARCTSAIPQQRANSCASGVLRESGYGACHEGPTQLQHRECGPARQQRSDRMQLPSSSLVVVRCCAVVKSSPWAVAQILGGPISRPLSAHVGLVLGALDAQTTCYDSIFGCMCVCCCCCSWCCGRRHICCYVCFVLWAIQICGFMGSLIESRHKRGVRLSAQTVATHGRGGSISGWGRCRVGRPLEKCRCLVPNWKLSSKMHRRQEERGLSPRLYCLGCMGHVLNSWLCGRSACSKLPWKCEPLDQQWGFAADLSRDRLDAVRHRVVAGRARPGLCSWTC